jgi:hypothetical protein
MTENDENDLQFDYNLILAAVGEEMEVVTKATGHVHFGLLVDVVNDVLLLLDDKTKKKDGFVQSWWIPLEDVKSVFVVHGGREVYDQFLKAKSGGSTE